MRFANDTRIRFFPDGSYRWTDLHTVRKRSIATSLPSIRSISSPRVRSALHVEGVVAGKVLIYSPRRIVIEDDLTYANDPRTDTGSDDYLGIVSDK